MAYIVWPNRETFYLTVIATFLAIGFLGLLVIDLVRRRRRARHRQRREPVSFRDRLLTPIRRMQAFRNDLRQLFHERARRARRHRRHPPDRTR